MIHLTDAAYDPPTLRFIPVARKLEASEFTPETDDHILWDAEAGVFVPRTVGRRLPACNSAGEAQAELSRRRRSA